jgi:hypothetical protein
VTSNAPESASAIRERLREIEALSKLLNEPDVTALWHQVAQLFERGHEMEVLIAAFRELVDDTMALHDPEQDGYVGAAIHVTLERRNDGGDEINVHLKQIAASQLAFVLSVARKYELEAREENGWLTLRPHLISSDLEEEEREPEAVEA